MKHVKKYEFFTFRDMRSGDYILRKNVDMQHYKYIFDNSDYEKIIDYLSNTIGEICTIYTDNKIKVKYKPTQEYLKFFKYDKNVGYYITLKVKDVLDFSSNKEDLEMIIQSNKYNL